MTVWTIQPVSALRQIEETGVFRCDPQKSFNLTKPDSLREPYQWLIGKMREKIGQELDGVVSPIWAWHTWDFAQKCPDPDSSAFLRRTEEKVLLTLEIPDDQVVLTDFDAWQNVMLGAYIPDAVTDEEAQKLEAWLDSLDEAALEEAVRCSWDNVFRTDAVNNDILVRGRFIQATFWEVRREYIRNAQILPPDAA